MRNIIILIFLSVLMIGNTYDVNAQCPDDAGWASLNARYEPYPSQKWGDVDIKFKQTGNTFEVKVDWSSMTKPGDMSDEDAREMMKLAIIWDLLGDPGSSCPPTNPMTYNIIMHEEVDCIMELACYLRIKRQNSLTCYPSAWGDLPDWFNFNGEYYYKKTEKVKCGTACCSTDYTVECQNSTYTGDGAWIVTNTAKTSTGCSTSTETDCLTGNPIPCEADCN